MNLGSKLEIKLKRNLEMSERLTTTFIEETLKIIFNKDLKASEILRCMQRF